jgi:putative DNA primase/helicase
MEIQSLFIAYGDGANGKTGWTDAMERIMGALYCEASHDVLIQAGRKNSAGAATPALIAVKDARLVMVSELPRNAVLNATDTKAWTGGNTMPARALYGHQITFKPQGKLVTQTNFRPQFDGSDKAWHRRIKLVPFEEDFNKPDANGECKNDPAFIEQMHTTHLNELFAFFAVGAHRWYTDRTLEMPTSVAQLQTEYMADNDPVADFLKDQCDVDAKHSVKSSALHEAFCAWAHHNFPDFKLSTKQFTAEMKRRKFKRKKSSVWYFVGLRITPTPQEREQAASVDPNDIDMFPQC